MDVHARAPETLPEPDEVPRRTAWTWAIAAGFVITCAFVSARVLFPASPRALAELDLQQVELPDPLPTNLKNEKGAILVVRIALDFRARDPETVREAVRTQAVRNRMTDALIEFYTNKTLDEVADPIHWALERRQLRQRLNPILFPDEDQGRIEQVLFLQHNVQH
ncbi:MAG: flagellar basal body-associated FliL family protein [Planctomycetes bacterium]|nr:flagellar basal body-associated FliL family protein [Planctomycetota bacterium]